ncbi:MAG: GGDEF domain-containing protein [Aquabacterium sp.]
MSADTPSLSSAPSPWQGTDAAQPEAFRALVQGIGVIAGLTHAAFCSLFFWSGVTSLAYINIGSVLCYVAVFEMARRNKVGQAWALTIAEVLGHAVLAVAVLGWDTGFHYYILLVIPVAVISSIRPVGLKAATVLGVMLTYLGLDIAFRHQGPAKALSTAVIDGLHYFNVVGVMVILIFLAGYYYFLIDKAATALREMAGTDPLTRLRNRRSMMELIRREESRVRRGQPYLSFILCDLDHFKGINDTLGHDAGDAVLKQASEVLMSGVRDVDFVARWGGEEFLVVLPDTDTEGARLVAERLRQKLEQAAFDHGQRPIRMTMTQGIATLQPEESADQAITRADTALYDGKRGGRNRVVLAAT